MDETFHDTLEIFDIYKPTVTTLSEAFGDPVDNESFESFMKNYKIEPMDIVSDNKTEQKDKTMKCSQSSTEDAIESDTNNIFSPDLKPDLSFYQTLFSDRSLFFSIFNSAISASIPNLDQYTRQKLVYEMYIQIKNVL